MRQLKRFCPRFGWLDVENRVCVAFPNPGTNSVFKFQFQRDILHYFLICEWASFGSERHFHQIFDVFLAQLTFKMLNDSVLVQGSKFTAILGFNLEAVLALQFKVRALSWCPNPATTTITGGTSVGSFSRFVVFRFDCFFLFFGLLVFDTRKGSKFSIFPLLEEKKIFRINSNPGPAKPGCICFDRCCKTNAMNMSLSVILTWV